MTSNRRGDRRGSRQPDWFVDAACRYIAPTLMDVFFPNKGEIHKAEAARHICASCPVNKVDCIEYGNRVARDYGIFAGLTPGQRREWAAARRNEREAAA